MNEDVVYMLPHTITILEDVASWVLSEDVSVALSVKKMQSVMSA